MANRDPLKKQIFVLRFIIAGCRDVCWLDVKFQHELKQDLDERGTLCSPLAQRLEDLSFTEKNRAAPA